MSDQGYDEKKPTEPTEVTRGGTQGSSNVLQVQNPYVWIKLVNAHVKSVGGQRCVVTNQADERETYDVQLSNLGSFRRDVPGADAIYTVDFPGITQGDWERQVPRPAGLTARANDLTLYRLKFRTLLIDELGVPMANTLVTVTYDDASTATPTTDGQGYLVMTVAPMGRKIVSVTLADVHESGRGEGVQTNSGTHHRRF